MPRNSWEIVSRHLHTAPELPRRPAIDITRMDTLPRQPAEWPFPPGRCTTPSQPRYVSGSCSGRTAAPEVSRHHVCICVPDTQACCASGGRECTHAAIMRIVFSFLSYFTRDGPGSILIMLFFWGRLSGDAIFWPPSLTQYMCDGIMADDNHRCQMPSGKCQCGKDRPSRVPCWKGNEVCR